MPPDQDRCSASFSHCKGRQCHSPCSDLGRVAYPIYTSSFLWFPCLFHARKCDLQFSTIQKGSLRRILQECHSFEMRPVIVHRCLNSWGRPKDGSMLQGMLQTSNVLLRLSRHWPEKIAINFPEHAFVPRFFRPHESTKTADCEKNTNKFRIGEAQLSEEPFNWLGRRQSHQPKALNIHNMRPQTEQISTVLN